MNHPRPVRTTQGDMLVEKTDGTVLILKSMMWEPQRSMCGFRKEGNHGTNFMVNREQSSWLCQAGQAIVLNQSNLCLLSICCWRLLTTGKLCEPASEKVTQASVCILSAMAASKSMHHECCQRAGQPLKPPANCYARCETDQHPLDPIVAD